MATITLKTPDGSTETFECDEDTNILDALDKMTEMVNSQNSKDPLYEPISAHLSDFAFRAAHDLCIHGRLQPNGYTEPILHENRVRKKATRHTFE